jgi:pantoate--beta-alanine ligase
VEVTGDPARFRDACREARHTGRSVGLVPTMGALHEGHAALIRAARSAAHVVALSIFVNPLQFGEGEDLSAYPRPRDGDLDLARELGVNVVFTPAERDLYPLGRPEVTVDPGPLGDRLEGRSRPGHFRGVLTVVAKLFDLTGPCLACFGEKDAQQLALIRRMVRDLDQPVTILPLPTVREPDGLARSSRNAYLSPPERAAAPVLFEALTDAATMVRNGERDGDLVRATLARTVGSEPLAHLDYVALVDDTSWEDVATIGAPARALVAARIGATRLIDTLLLPWEPAGASGG